jgi:hypothetical protein
MCAYTNTSTVYKVMLRLRPHPGGGGGGGSAVAAALLRANSYFHIGKGWGGTGNERKETSVKVVSRGLQRDAVYLG